MKKIKKILIIMLTLMFSVTLLSGCGGESGKNKKGRYIEEDYSMPEGISYVVNMQKLEDDTLAILAHGEYSKEETFKATPLKYFESKDFGQTWNEVDIKLPEKNGDNTISYNNGVITSDGKFLLNFIEYTPEEIEKMNEEIKNYSEGSVITEETDETPNEDDVQIFEEGQDYEYEDNSKWVIADKDGNLKDISDSDSLKGYGEVKVDNKGNAYFLSYEPSKIIQVDLETGKVKNTFAENSDYINQFITLGDSLIASDFKKVTKYNIENGKEDGELEALSKKATASLNYYNGENDEIMYMVGDDGVYSYKLGNEVVEKLIEGTMSTFGDSNYYLNSFVATKDNEFLAVFSNFENEEIVLKHYYFSKNVASKPDNQITIYSLYEDESIKQAIVKYQKDNPDVYINYELGIDYESSESITIDDAIKALNTKIMAGKGPDIINLAGLPVESYIDKGLLDDISSIVDNINKDDLFTNILNYGSKNKKIYAVPARFSIPVAFNKTDKNIQTLSDFAKEVKSIKESYSGDIVTPINADEILYYFYRSCGMSLLNDDNSLNKEAIKEFLDNAKTIYDEAKDSHSDATIKKHDEYLQMFEEYSAELSDNEKDLAGNFAKNFYGGGGDYFSAFSKNAPAISIADIYSLDDIFTIYSGKKKFNTSFTSWKGMGSNAVTPNVLVGLSSKSENKEIAKEFINALFTEEYQALSSYSGIPINKNVLKANLTDTERVGGSMGFDDGSGETIEIEYVALSDEDVNEIVSLIESYEGWSIVDDKIIDETIEDMKSYVEGKTSIDEAISNIDKKLKVYLSE